MLLLFAQLVCFIDICLCPQLYFATSSSLGRMTGIHEQPETVARGRSGRMVIATIEFTLMPHTPFAVASTSSANVEPSSIFWSDLGGADCVYRALADGSQVQEVMVDVRTHCVLSGY